MKTKHQENGALTGPLILTTLPASNFVAILRLEWLDGIVRAIVFPQKRTVGSGIWQGIAGRKGRVPQFHLNDIALTPDNKWLYFQATAGPTLHRMRPPPCGPR